MRLPMSRRAFVSVGLGLFQSLWNVPRASASTRADPGDFPIQVMQLGSELQKKLGDRWSAVTDEKGMDGPGMIGAKLSFVPPLGKVVWELPQRIAAAVPFTARIYQTENNRRIGYIRIPSYEYDEEVVKQFSGVVTYLEKSTRALVVDEVSNPGGSMFQMYAMLSCLTDRRLSLPKHEFRFDQNDVDTASEVIARADSGQAEPDDTPQLIAYSRFVVSEVKAGRGLGEHNTRPGYLGGVEEIVPAKSHYTKKIVVLINELSFSAAEFFAAILQDNHRATLFGATTAGAGGCAKRIQLPNGKQFGIEYITLPWTLAWRTNGKTIEDVGVSPDVDYGITVEDLRSDYSGYRKALLKTIN